MSDGSGARLWLGHHNHIWSCELADCRADDGTAVRVFYIIDGFCREHLAIKV